MRALILIISTVTLLGCEAQIQPRNTGGECGGSADLGECIKVCHEAHGLAVDRLECIETAIYAATE
ncbi:MAG: hypothetical protein DHS20C04_27340 [Hyphococcus sp.]|nr:MAG: hypothetical protein DHS20C04_27340 [Marinicaulis sp.]